MEANGIEAERIIYNSFSILLCEMDSLYAREF